MLINVHFFLLDNIKCQACKVCSQEDTFQNKRLKIIFMCKQKPNTKLDVVNRHCFVFSNIHAKMTDFCLLLKYSREVFNYIMSYYSKLKIDLVIKRTQLH